MDHHCRILYVAWVNNCVGFRNRKLFILLLAYGLALGYFSLFLLAEPFYHSIKKSFDQDLSFQPDYLYIFVFFMLLGLMFLLSIFSKFHIKIVFKNVTTIETILHAETHGSYNSGVYYNFLQVFGSNRWLWVLPVYGKSGMPCGDGVNWIYANSEMSEPASEMNGDLVPDGLNASTVSKVSFISASTHSRVASVNPRVGSYVPPEGQ